MSEVIDAEKEFEVVALKNEIARLKKELAKYQILLNEVDNEANPDFISDEEIICVEQIRKLKDDSVKRHLSKDEVKKLETLFKVLSSIRGTESRVTSKNKASKLTPEELADIAKG